jgi:hypothetical protein
MGEPFCGSQSPIETPAIAANLQVSASDMENLLKQVACHGGKHVSARLGYQTMNS